MNLRQRIARVLSALEQAARDFSPACFANSPGEEYVVLTDLIYNRLHDQLYSSIGCAPCTRPIAPGEDIRAGRWWWERPEDKECGLHLTAFPPGPGSAGEPSA